MTVQYHKKRDGNRPNRKTPGMNYPSRAQILPSFAAYSAIRAAESSVVLPIHSAPILAANACACWLIIAFEGIAMNLSRTSCGVSLWTNNPFPNVIPSSDAM